jgi:hemoglobin
MKIRLLLFAFLFPALVGCATGGGGEEEASGDETETAAEGGEEALSDKPMGEGEETAEGEEAAEGTDEPTTERPLFDRIGGKGKLQSFADKFVDALVANPDLNKNPQLAAALKADQSRHKQMLAEFFCANTGGTCMYNGRTMKEAHAPVKVSKAEWNVMRKLFIRTLRQMKVPKKERMELAVVAARQTKHIVQ